jgi:hypothetical protein
VSDCPVKAKELDLHGYIHCIPYGKPTVPLSSWVIPSDPGMMLLSVRDFVPFVMMLFPLQPGYTITVWADASDQLATTKTSSVKRNMMAGRSYSAVEAMEGPPWLRCSSQLSSARLDGSRRKPAACGGGGHQHLWGARLGSKCLVQPCRFARRRLAACKWSRQTNEGSKTGPPSWPASACQPSKH